MNDVRRKQIEKDIDAFCELCEISRKCLNQVSDLEKRISSLGKQLLRVSSSLYKDRSKEYLGEVIECLRATIESKDELVIQKALDELLRAAEERYNKHNVSTESQDNQNSLSGFGKNFTKEDAEKLMEKLQAPSVSDTDPSYGAKNIHYTREMAIKAREIIRETLMNKLKSFNE